MFDIVEVACSKPRMLQWVVGALGSEPSKATVTSFILVILIVAGKPKPRTVWSAKLTMMPIEMGSCFAFSIMVVAVPSHVSVPVGSAASAIDRPARTSNIAAFIASPLLIPLSKRPLRTWLYQFSLALVDHALG